MQIPVTLIPFVIADINLPDGIAFEPK